MALGEHLYELRKNKNYSQEDVAGKLNVARQTISKWETNQSTPDFDKIIPLCDLYGISTDELLRGTKTEIQDQKNISLYEERKKQRQEIAKGICLSLLLYFIAMIWLIVVGSLDVMLPGIMLGIFLLICAMATINLVD